MKNEFLIKQRDINGEKVINTHPRQHERNVEMWKEEEKWTFAMCVEGKSMLKSKRETVYPSVKREREKSMSLASTQDTVEIIPKNVQRHHHDKTASLIDCFILFDASQRLNTMPYFSLIKL